MCIKQEHKRLEMWLEKERCGSKVTPILRTEASELKVRDEESVDRCIEVLGNTLIWSGRPRMMSSVLEGLS